MNKKILSVFFAAVLLISCVAGVLVIGGSAVQDPTVIYTAAEYDDGVNPHFADIITALQEADKKNGQWKADDVLEIRFQGEQISAGGHNGLMFTQTTIWREDGTKLPITIRGIDMKESRDSWIYVDSAGGWYACANDYTFVNLTLPIGSHGTTFYAGSGEVKFENCNLSFPSSSRIMVPDAASQQELISLCYELSNTICEETGVNRLPVGDAWATVINDPTSPFYSEEYGYLLRAMASKGTLYGDWTHDGDIGGGQYLNACIVFEVLTHMSCLDLTWEPTYTLVNSDMSFSYLRQLAHDTVSEVYGEDYYQETAPDVGADGKFNILFPGSSTCYYFADELASLGRAAGLDMTVVNPYVSSLRINPQWEYIQSEAEVYQYRVWYDSGSGAKLTTTASQSLQSIVDDMTWDAAFIYTAASVMDDYGLDPADHDANMVKLLEDHTGAEPTLEFLETNCPGAELFFYTPPASPIGAFGSSTTLTGYIFGDNCTDAAFVGWELAEGEKVKTGITFGDDVQYICSTAPDTIRIAASGYLFEETSTAYTEEAANAVTFAESGMEGVSDIRPIDTEPYILIDGTNAAVQNVSAKLGGSPCDATVHLKKGSVNRISGDNYTDQADGEAVEQFYGDMNIIVTGGNVGGHVDVTWESNLIGDINVTINNSNGNVNLVGRVRTCFGLTGVGNSTTTIQNVNVGGSLHLGGGNGTVINTVENCTSGGYFIGARAGSPTSITNELKNVTFTGTDASFMGTYGTATNSVTNDLENCSFAGSYYGGNYSGIVRENITNTIKDSDFAAIYYGGNRLSNITGSVINKIEDSDFATTYYGGTASSSSRSDTIGGQIINKIDGTSFGGSYFYCGNQHASFKANDTLDFRIENEISDVTASACRFIGSSSNSATDSIKNAFSGINDILYTYCASNNQAVNSVENHFAAQFTGGMVCGGSNNASVGSIVNYVEEGADLGLFYAGLNSHNSTTYTLGSITNNLNGGQIESFYGAGKGGTITTVTNVVGDTENHTVPTIGTFYGGANTGVVASADTTIYGGIFNGVVKAGSQANTVTNTPALTVIAGDEELAFYGNTEITALSGSGILTIGEDTAIHASSAEGKIIFHQSENWVADHSYVTLPEGNAAQVIVTTAGGATGTWVTETGSNDEVLVLKGSDIQKNAAETPSAPTLLSKADTTVVLAEEEGFEYSLDGENWQMSGTFEGLTPATAYTFYRRTMETSTHFSSAASYGLSVTTDEGDPYILGDVDGSGTVNSDDAIYLLYHTLYENDYPVNQPVDFNGDDSVNSDDAIYLLYHTLYENDYPLEVNG